VLEERIDSLFLEVDQMTLRQQLVWGTILALAVPASSPAAVTVSNGPSAPGYATVLNFDELGGPTGANVPNNSWAASPWFISDFSSGTVTSNFVGNNAFATGDASNSYAGPFGVFITYANDLTEMSFQGWDDSGAPTPIGGGAGVFVFNNGVEVGTWFGTPAFGGAGDPWFNITTDGGSVFDEVRFLGFGFSPTSYVDNLSWNVVPEPAALVLLGLCALTMLRFRRNR
jgi:hypothetical protein